MPRKAPTRTPTRVGARMVAVRPPTVVAHEDTLKEGLHFSRITHQITSNDAGYQSVAVPFVDVSIADDDAPGVLIRQTNGASSVIEVPDRIEIGTGPVTGATATTSPSSFRSTWRTG